MSGRGMSMSADVPAVIVGANGRIGDLLASVGEGKDVLVGRDDPIPEGEGPIYICTRNNVLEDIIEKTPPERREDLVFLQNGYIQEFLDDAGLGANTQALIYFAVAKKGETPIDGKTDMNPEGLTVATGKWAEALTARIKKCDLACAAVDAKTYEKAMFEKLIWICAFMLVGALNGGVTVGEVESRHTAQVGGRRCAVEPVAALLCAYLPASVFGCRSSYLAPGDPALL